MISAAAGRRGGGAVYRTTHNARRTQRRPDRPALLIP